MLDLLVFTEGCTINTFNRSSYIEDVELIAIRLSNIIGAFRLKRCGMSTYKRIWFSKVVG